MILLYCAQDGYSQLSPPTAAIPKIRRSPQKQQHIRPPYSTSAATGVEDGLPIFAGNRYLISGIPEKLRCEVTFILMCDLQTSFSA